MADVPTDQELIDTFEAFFDEPDPDTYVAIIPFAAKSEHPQVVQYLRDADDLAAELGWFDDEDDVSASAVPYESGYSAGYEDAVKDAAKTAADDWDPTAGMDPDDVGYEKVDDTDEDNHRYLTVTVAEWTDGDDSKPLSSWGQVHDYPEGEGDDLALQVADSALRPSKWWWRAEDDEGNEQDGEADSFQEAISAAEQVSF